jgi:hypothetical protein
MRELYQFLHTLTALYWAAQQNPSRAADAVLTGAGLANLSTRQLIDRESTWTITTTVSNRQSSICWTAAPTGASRCAGCLPAPPCCPLAAAVAVAHVPGCYAGRMPHIHFEVYPSLAKANSAANKIKTSQLGFPNAVMNEAYTATGYAASVRNFANISFATDNVFSDGTTLQIATVTGSVSQGYVATLAVGVSV